MENKMELAKFLVKTGNFDEIHIYVHGEKAVSVAKDLAGNSCYAENSGMWIEAVDEDLVFVTLSPDVSVADAIETLGSLGFGGMYAQVYVGIQQGPCYEEIYPLTGVFEIPGAAQRKREEKEMKLSTISTIKRNAAMGRETVHGAYTYRVAWNEEANEFGIQRARTCDADRQWIDADGNITSAWRWVK